MSATDATALLFPWLANYLVHSTLLLGAAFLILHYFAPRSVQLRERIWRFAIWGGLVSASLSLAPGFRPFFAFAPSEVAALDLEVPTDSRATRAEPESFSEPVPAAPEGQVTASGTDPSEERLNTSAGTAIPTVQRSSQEPRPANILPTERHFEPRAERSLLETSSSQPFVPAVASRPVVRTDEPFPVRETSPNSEPVIGWVHQDARDVPARFTSKAPGTDQSLAGSGATSFVPATTPRTTQWNELRSAVLGRLSALPSSRLIPAVLGCGTLALILTLVACRRRMTGDLRGRVQITNGPLVEELQGLLAKAGSKRSIRLSIAPHLSAPVSFGFLRAEIALPPRAEFDLDRAQLRAVLAHELAHCLRRDPAHFTLLVVLERLLFFQPLNRLARRELLSLAELLCDDQAVRLTGKSLPLASSLAEVARWIIEGPDAAQTAAAMVSKRSPLTERVERLLDDREHLAPAGRHRWFAPLTFALVPAAALGLPGVVVAEAPETPELADVSIDEPLAPAESNATTDAPERPEPVATVAEPAEPATEPEPAPTPTGPPIGLRLSYELFESELDSTESELSLLEEDLEEAGLLGEFAEPLDRMQERLDTLARQAEAVDRLLPHLDPPVGGDE